MGLRSLLLLAEMLFLLPVAIGNPFIGVMAYWWVSFMNPQQEAWGIGTYPPWALASFIATVIGWAISRTEPKRIAISPNSILCILFLVGIWITAQFAIPVATLSKQAAHGRLVASGFNEWEGLITATKIFVVLIISESLLTTKHRVDAMLWLITLSLGYYVLEQGGATLVTLGHHHALGPLRSQIGDNNTFAVALLALVPILNHLRQNVRYASIRAGFLLAMFIAVFTAMASFSRGAFITIVAQGAVVWWKSKHKLVSLFACFALAGMLYVVMPQSWLDRMETIKSYQTQGSAESRLYSWKVAWELFRHHPWTGVGFHGTDHPEVIDSVVRPQPVVVNSITGDVKIMPGRLMEIHSIWMQMLAENGLILFVTWVGLTVVGVLTTMRMSRLTEGKPELRWAHSLARMLQISIVGYAVGGTFLPISIWDVYLVLLTILAATRAIVLKEVQSTKAITDSARRVQFQRIAAPEWAGQAARWRTGNSKGAA